MVNLIESVKPLLHGLMKMAGVVPQAVDIDSGTVINIWVPRHGGAARTKPAVVLVHGFAADGITTWLFQVGSLTKNYAVYVPDLLFFGGSATDRRERSPAFQAECLAKALRKLGVERCAVVGFSYGVMVALKMAELQPELVEAVVVSGSAAAMTESVSAAALERLGFPTWQKLLLPESVEGCKKLLEVAMHKKLSFPNRLYKDFLQAMFRNTSERAELLEGLVVPSTIDTNIPKLSQRIHLLWGEHDQIINQELAQNLQKDVGDKATYEVINKAGIWFMWRDPAPIIDVLSSFLPKDRSTNLI